MHECPSHERDFAEEAQREERRADGHEAVEEVDGAPAVGEVVVKLWEG